ncbi:hypothetical protein D3C72_1289610 [compost metagenome]
MQLHLAFRVALHEAADQQCGQVIADGQGRTHGQRAETGFAIEQVLDFLGLVQQRHRLWQQLFAQGVQAQPFAGTVEQLAAALALQFGDRGARRRLREVEQARSTGYAFLLGDGDEYLKLTESKSHIDITDNPYLNNPFNRYCLCL